MSIYSADVYTPDGRLRGAYVFMLLCQVQLLVHIRVSRSADPLARIDALSRSCDVAPAAICVAEVQSHKKAVIIERELHEALQPWHSHRDWFAVDPSERCAFNACWKPVIESHSTASRRIQFSHFSVPSLILEAKNRAKLPTLRFGRSRDFRHGSAGGTS